MCPVLPFDRKRERNREIGRDSASKRTSLSCTRDSNTAESKREREKEEGESGGIEREGGEGEEGYRKIQKEHLFHFEPVRVRESETALQKSLRIVCEWEGERTGRREEERERERDKEESKRNTSSEERERGEDKRGGSFRRKE